MPRQGKLRLIAGLASLLACVPRETVDECVRQMPQPPVDYAQRCDVPGAIATAKDQGCGYYVCSDGRWSAPIGYSGCSWSLLGRNEPAEYCPRYCIADLDPDTMQLDESCGFASYELEGDGGIAIPRCDLVDGVWQVPMGATYCVGLATQDTTASESAFQACHEQGVNAAFVIVGNTLAAVPEGFEFAVGCAFEMYPVAPCPLERFDAPPLEPSSCTSEG